MPNAPLMPDGVKESPVMPFSSPWSTMTRSRMTRMATSETRKMPSTLALSSISRYPRNAMMSRTSPVRTHHGTAGAPTISKRPARMTPSYAATASSVAR